MLAAWTIVIWAGVEDVHDGLMALHREVHRALAAAHIEMPPVSFHPHITLARLKNVPAHKLQSFQEANRSREFGTVQFNHFTLFSSALGPIGAIHHVEERYALVSE